MTVITAPSTATKDAFLRFAMRLDAGISGVMGIAGIAMASRIAEVSGTSPAIEYSMGALGLSR